MSQKGDGKRLKKALKYGAAGLATVGAILGVKKVAKNTADAIVSAPANFIRAGREQANKEPIPTSGMWGSGTGAAQANAVIASRHKWRQKGNGIEKKAGNTKKKVMSGYGEALANPTKSEGRKALY